MAKYFISADMEGVCGVASILQCYPKADTTGYYAAVEQLAAEIKAVYIGIRAVDPDAKIVVNDAHSTMTNLGLGHLPEDIELLSGKPKLCAMMSGLDNSFAAAFLVGYHAKAGTEKGVLNHTFHQKLFDVSINGVSYGEGGINALYAHWMHNVPVILGSGDRAFCEEITAFLPSMVTVETKVGLTTTAAHSHSKASVLKELEAKTKHAMNLLSRGVSFHLGLGDIQAPYTLKLTFIDTLPCDVAMTSPLYKRLDGRTLEYQADNFETLYRGLQSAYTMLNYTSYME
jgi:D-amino peptidase